MNIVQLICSLDVKCMFSLNLIKIIKTSFNKFNSPKYQLEGKKIIRFGFVKYEKGDVEIKFDVFYPHGYHYVS